MMWLWRDDDDDEGAYKPPVAVGALACIHAPSGCMPRHAGICTIALPTLGAAGKARIAPAACMHACMQLRPCPRALLYN